MKNFILLNILMSLFFSVDFNCMMRSVDLNATGTSMIIKQLKKNNMLPKLYSQWFQDTFNVQYSNRLSIGTDMKQFSGLVSNVGFSKIFIKQDLWNTILVMPINYVYPWLQIIYINDEIRYGVFAKEFIKKGSLIRQYVGNVCLCERNDDFNETEHSVLLYESVDKFGNNCFLNIVSKKIGNESRFFNHSYDPNCCIRPVYSFESPEFVQYWIVALKDILPGQEIVWNYGVGYWQCRNIVPRETNNIKNVYQDKNLTVYLSKKVDELYQIFINGKCFDQLYMDSEDYFKILGFKSFKEADLVYIIIVIEYKDGNFKSQIPITICKTACDQSFFNLKKDKLYSCKFGIEYLPKITKEWFNDLTKLKI